MHEEICDSEGPMMTKDGQKLDDDEDEDDGGAGCQKGGGVKSSGKNKEDKSKAEGGVGR